jgi:hypothetical protein
MIAGMHSESCQDEKRPCAFCGEPFKPYVAKANRD